MRLTASAINIIII